MRNPDWQTDDGSVRLYLADCLDVLPELEGVDAVVTSPPYAEQRADTYGGIAEASYPVFTANWLSLVPLSETGSALINIREHRTKDGMSDYVHRTRLCVRESGWCEVDELIWIKPDAMPTAPNSLPRRGWERVLWFARTSLPHCNAKDTSKTLSGFNQTLNKYAVKIGAAPTGTEKNPIHPRKLNYIRAAIGGGPSVEHPAKYPEQLAGWLVELVTSPSMTALDPFMGSGTTGVACIRTGRQFIGIEKEPKYFDIAVKRIGAELARTPLFAEALA